MAIKTFTTGEVLTASDTNTYLANSGLVFIKQQTVGTTVGSVTVSDAFSATYDNYKITYTAGVSSTSGTNLALTLGATATGYYSSLIAVSYSTSGAINIGGNNLASFTYGGIARSTYSHANLDIFSPFTAQRTTIDGAFINNDAAGQFVGLLDNTTSYTAFTFTTGAGTITGGTITVYGYRKG
jgi:hypothetical protein